MRRPKSSKTDYRSPEAAAWRGWYSLARWKRLRQAQLAAHPLCAMCLEAGITNAGTLRADGGYQPDNRRHFLVADHVLPHRGDPELFWGGDLQTLCPDHHDITKQQTEARGYRPGCDLRGRPTDEAHPWNQPGGMGVGRSLDLLSLDTGSQLHLHRNVFLEQKLGPPRRGEQA